MSLGTTKPQWRKVSTSLTAKAHLVDGSKIGMQAWCGMTLDSSVDGPYDERCTQCVAAVQEYVTQSLLDPPKTVTSSYLLTVTRPASAEDPVKVLERKLTGRTTWTWTVQPA